MVPIDEIMLDILRATSLLNEKINIVAAATLKTLVYNRFASVDKDLSGGSASGGMDQVIAPFLRLCV